MSKDPHNGISKAGTKISKRADFNALLDNIVEAQLDKENLEGRRDAEILKITNKYSEEVDALGKEIEESFKRAEEYATEHRGEIFNGEVKSSDFGSATF